MLPLSSKDTIEFTPAHYEHATGAPVYFIAVPTYQHRAAIRRSLAAMGAQYPTDEAMFALMREGIKEQVGESDVNALLEMLDAYEAMLERMGSTLNSDVDNAQISDEDVALIATIKTLEDDLRRHHPPYAAALADRSYYLDLLPSMNFKHCVAGWSHADPKFSHSFGVVSDDAINALPIRDVIAVGWHIQKLTVPSKELEKN